MPISNVYIYNFRPDGSSDFLTTTVTAASASTALPANTETLMVQVTGNVHFRIGTSGVTAVQNDPLMSSQQGPVIVKLPQSAGLFIAYILDINQTGAEIGRAHV